MRPLAVRGLCFCLVAFGPLAASYAGGGPENLFLVVNSRSWASQYVANEYIAARGIPDGNVFHLDYGSYLDGLPTKFFRSMLLEPILDEIKRRGLSNQIDYVVYSTDFPYRFNATEDLKGRDIPPQVGPFASLTGLTYLYDKVRRGDGEYASLDVPARRHANRYYRGEALGDGRVGSIGFRSWYGWGSSGEVLEAGGERYLLSTMLGSTHPRGNSVSEILAYLRRAVESDGSRPPGTIYYVSSNDIRSRTRRGDESGPSDRFAAAVRLIEAEGVAARVITGDNPPPEPDIAGLMLGKAGFRWPAAAHLTPGAIAEHFTSFGGVLSDDAAAASQLPLSVMLAHGAAGASGTVAEPMSYYQKFPSSTLQVHYVRGCSLAESFYQSTASPYQLLIVGDPLARPWAKIPRIEVSGLPADGRASGILPLSAEVVEPADFKTSQIEVFVDGVRRAVTVPGKPIGVPTTRLADGSHELRFVAAAADPIQTQGAKTVRLWFDNGGFDCELTADNLAPRWDEYIEFAARADGAVRIELRSQGRVLAEIASGSGRTTIPASQLGQGPVEIQAVAFGPRGSQTEESGDEEKELVRGVPLRLVIGSPEPHTGARLVNGPQRGLRLDLPGRPPLTVATTATPGWFKQLGVGPAQPYRLRAGFSVESPSLYQFIAAYAGDFEMKVDGRTVASEASAPFGFRYYPVSLTAGVHSLEIVGRTAPQGDPVLELRFGGAGVRALSSDQFWHEGG